MIQAELSPEEKQDEAKREQLRIFREAVIWFLNRRLEMAGKRQSDMVETRLDREREKAKSALYRAKGTGTSAPYNMSASAGADELAPTSNGSLENRSALSEKPDGAGSETLESLSPEQLQLFEREQQDMMQHYNEELNKIRQAEGSLLEISQLQSQIAMNLEVQETHIDQLVQDSFSTTANVGDGNKELKKASERASTARMVFWATCALCSTLIVWDLVI